MITLVLDANILFSIMKPRSTASYLFSSLRTNFIAPKHIQYELEKYKAEWVIKSKLSEHEFQIRRVEVEEKVHFYDHNSYQKFLKKAVSALPDATDAPYLALALAQKATIWSNDPHLKEQSLIIVLTTKELVDELLKDEV